jgi:hypothetical protein
LVSVRVEWTSEINLPVCASNVSTVVTEHVRDIW